MGHIPAARGDTDRLRIDAGLEALFSAALDKVARELVPVQQADLAIAVGKAAVGSAQAGGGDVLALGVQHAGDGNELQGTRVDGQKAVVDGEVRAGIQLGLREDNLAVLVDEFIV